MRSDDSIVIYETSGRGRRKKISRRFIITAPVDLVVSADWEDSERSQAALSKFTWALGVDETGIAIDLAGGLHEGSKGELMTILASLPEHRSQTVRINCSEIRQINSIGAGALRAFLTILSNEQTVLLDHCSSSITDCASMIPGFLGSAKIRSCVLAIHCEKCASVDEVLFHAKQAKGPIVAESCSQCGELTVAKLDLDGFLTPGQFLA